MCASVSASASRFHGGHRSTLLASLAVTGRRSSLESNVSASVRASLSASANSLYRGLWTTLLAFIVVAGRRFSLYSWSPVDACRFNRVSASVSASPSANANRFYFTLTNVICDIPIASHSPQQSLVTPSMGRRNI